MCESSSNERVEPQGSDECTPSKHSKYYIYDEMSTFLVQGQLFRVHRYYLTRESAVFHTMFELPSGAADVEGTTDHNPIILPDVTSREFECLLDFLYDGMHDDYRHTVPLGDWVNVLSIATRFVCDKIRDRAIREIDEYRPAIDPVDKIVLAFKHDVPSWLEPSYATLRQRAQPLDLAEAEKLGLPITMRLAQEREEFRKESSARRSKIVDIYP